MAFPNLNNDFKTADELDNLEQLSGYGDALHQNQNVDLTQETKDGKTVQKFFDYMALHVLIPCINALNRAVLALKGNTSTSLEALEKKLTALSGNTTASMEALEALDEEVNNLLQKQEELPIGLLSVDDLSDPATMGLLALQQAMAIFPDISENNLKKHNFVFKERKTGDLYYGTIGNLILLSEFPDLLKKIGCSSKDYEETILNLAAYSEKQDADIQKCGADVLELKERVGTLEIAETKKPVAFVEVDNFETVLAAQKILSAVNASGLVPEGAEADKIPAYVYDRNTKFLYKCTSRKAAEIFARLAIGGTPEMPEKICYLGDMVSKQYVDDLFYSIVDGNEVEY